MIVVGLASAWATSPFRLVVDGELVIIRDTSHLPNIENPQAFNEALRAFLAKNAEADEPAESDDSAESAEGETADAD